MFLQAGIEGRAYCQHAVVAELLRVGEFFDLVIGVIEIPVGRDIPAAIDRRRRIAQSRENLALCHVARVDEIVEHVVGAGAGRGQVDMRREFRWRLE